MNVPHPTVRSRSAVAVVSRIPGDAGLDLYSRVDVTLAPGERALPTGVAIALPLPGMRPSCIHEAVWPVKHGIGVVNGPGRSTPGTGEIQVPYQS